MITQLGSPERGPVGVGREVSVVLTFDDKSRFLPEAVASVVAQVGVDWELLLVDDGSIEASTEWAQDTASRAARAAVRFEPSAPMPRIRYVEHPGHSSPGISASRDLGIRHAIGRWVTFLDGEDVWRPGKLAVQLGILAATPEVEVLVSPAEPWYQMGNDQTGEAEDQIQDLSATRSERSIVLPPTLLTSALRDGWATIYDLVIGRRALQLLGRRWGTLPGGYDDRLLHARVLSQLPAVVTSGSWYQYRQHELSSASARNRLSEHKAREQFLTWLDHHIMETVLTRTPAGRELEALVRTERRNLRRRHLLSIATSAWRREGYDSGSGHRGRL